MCGQPGLQSKTQNYVMRPCLLKQTSKQTEKEHDAGIQKEKRKDLKCMNSEIKILHRCKGRDGKI